MKISKSIYPYLIVVVIFFSTAGFLYASSRPSTPPTSGNPSTPLNTGYANQVKDGGIFIRSLGLFGYRSTNTDGVAGLSRISTAGVSNTGVLYLGRVGFAYAAPDNRDRAFSISSVGNIKIKSLEGTSTNQRGACVNPSGDIVVC